MIVRDLRAADEAAWRRLWDGYLGFYGQSLPEAVTRATWQRLLDPASPVLGRVAEDGQPTEPLLVGLCHCVLHAGTWSPPAISKTCSSTPRAAAAGSATP